MKAACSYDFGLIYDIFNKIANEKDSEAMDFAINEKVHETKYMNQYEHYLDIFTYSLKKSNFNLAYFMIESGIDYTQQLSAISKVLNNKNAQYFFKIPHFDVSARNKFNENALVRASRNGQHEVVKLLLTVPGIDVNAKDKWNKTALSWASWKGHHEIVKLLLKVPGIDVNAKDKWNKTALMDALNNGHHEVVKLLLKVPGINTDIHFSHV